MITIYGSKTHKQFKLVSFTPLLLKAYFLSSENYLGTSEKRFFSLPRHFFIRRPRLFCSTNCKLFFNKWAGNQLKIFIFSPKIEVVRFSSLVRFRRLSPTPIFKWISLFLIVWEQFCRVTFFLAHLVCSICLQVSLLWTSPHLIYSSSSVYFCYKDPCLLLCSLKIRLLQ